ncbi:unnamed protein product, partial [Closterium sp. NIES-54]
MPASLPYLDPPCLLARRPSAVCYHRLPFHCVTVPLPCAFQLQLLFPLLIRSCYLCLLACISLPLAIYPASTDYLSQREHELQGAVEAATGKGIAERGVAERGVAERGVAERGVAERGVAVRGVAERGVAVRGVAERGVAERGVAVRGVAVRGVAVRGVAVRGVAVRGVAVRGVAVRGVAVRGVAVRGAAASANTLTKHPPLIST